MKVWVVEYCSEDHGEYGFVMNVYATEEKAKEFVAESKPDAADRWYYEISEWDVL